MTNMGPSPEYPYSDVFVRRQVDMLRRLAHGDETIDYFRLPRRLGSIAGSIEKYTTGVLRFGGICLRRYDVLHLHYAYPLLPLLLFYRRLHPRARLVVSFLGSDVNQQLARGVRRSLFRRWAAGMDHTQAVSHALAEAAEQALGRRIDAVLSVGVDSTTFYPVPGTEKRFDLLFVGRFVAPKGIPHLLEAVRALDDGGLRVCFAGSGQLLDEIRALRARYDITVALHPSDVELRSLYNQARFLILPSETEGLPVVIGEAFMCGTPVIATRVGGVEEVLTDGYNGLFLAAPSAPAIVDAVARARAMSPEAYAALAANARKSADRHSVETICRQQLEIYRRFARR